MLKQCYNINISSTTIHTGPFYYTMDQKNMPKMISKSWCRKHARGGENKAQKYPLPHRHTQNF